jgi:hypothetical protein
MVTFDSKQCPAWAQNEMQQDMKFVRCSEYEILKGEKIVDLWNT